MSIAEGCDVKRSLDDTGSISAFVVGIAVVFIVCAGLAVDSGRMVAAHVRVADVAENAARLGAQEIVGIRSGSWYVEPDRAAAAARALLRAEGVTGEVEVSARTVTVTAATTVRPTVLRLFGIGDRTVRASRAVEPRSP
jgi:Flp pilus assembly protein TadG